MFALVTADAAVGLDPDLEPLAAALVERVGREAVSVVSWDDPEVEWSRFDAAVIRSTWDYTARLDEFLAWVERVATATRLVNRAPAVRWSADKRYLADLADAGIRIPPTRWIVPGDASMLADRAAVGTTAALAAPDGVVVVKPTVGAGASGAARCGTPDEVGAQVAALHAEGFTAMIQPYLNGLDEYGETSLCFVPSADGGLELSHAFSKGAILTMPEVEQVGGLFAKEEIGAREPTAAEVAMARRVIESEPVRSLGELDFARVDLAVHRPDDVAADRSGRNDPDSLVVCELELIEPSFFLSTSPGAAERLADSLIARIGRRDEVAS